MDLKLNSDGINHILQDYENNSNVAQWLCEIFNKK